VAQLLVRCLGFGFGSEKHTKNILDETYRRPDHAAKGARIAMQARRSRGVAVCWRKYWSQSTMEEGPHHTPIPVEKIVASDGQEANFVSNKQTN
jgi:hypothetical protein